MTYELVDFTCLGDAACRTIVGHDFSPRSYQRAVLALLVDEADSIQALIVKTRRCADDFERLGKEWARVIRRLPCGKRARRAAFYARQRVLRAAR